MIHTLAPEYQARLAQLDRTARRPKEKTSHLALEKTLAHDVASIRAFDVVLLGGGLSVLYAALLAKQGFSVAIVERGRIGFAHREWNASEAELQALIDVGLLTPQRLDALILARYTHGICRWHNGHTTRVTKTLDCAVHAQGLLDDAKAMALLYGAVFFEETMAQSVTQTEQALVVHLHAAAQNTPKDIIKAQLVLDGRGTQSPFAQADLVCPTVGGVLEGLDVGDGPQQINPRVGDILATTEDVEDGRQHIWEAFPLGSGKTAVYLFYYAQADDLPAAPLASLYERFWTTLPRFKTGDARLVRPTFGLIPGWSRLSLGPRSPHRRLWLVGDAAARQSPLTFCGFGATLRSLAPVLNAAKLALSQQPKQLPTRAKGVVDDRALHQLTGALAMIMTRPSGRPDALNQLLDAAFMTLSEMGDEAFGALLRDEMPAREVARFMWRTSKRYPAVWPAVWHGLGPALATRWAAQASARLVRGR